MTKCPICNSELKNYTPNPGPYDGFHCIRCGKYRAITEVLNFSDRDEFSPDFTHKLSYFIRKNQKTNRRIKVDCNTFRYVQQNVSLPTLNEIVDIIILYLGNHVESNGYGSSLDISIKEVVAEFGCKSNKDVEYIINFLENQGYLSKDLVFDDGSPRLQLCYDGWEKYNELKSGESAGKNGFMAMKFFDESKEYFENYIRPAVQAAGFDIRTTTDNQGAGNIDNQIRDEIRLSKFLIADLTHDNNGAYWEAGFAEGIGKPVIYLCEKNKSASQ